eukprot:2751796-Rhodomonas_salina.3
MVLPAARARGGGGSRRPRAPSPPMGPPRCSPLSPYALAPTRCQRSPLSSYALAPTRCPRSPLLVYALAPTCCLVPTARMLLPAGSLGPPSTLLLRKTASVCEVESAILLRARSHILLCAVLYCPTVPAYAVSGTYTRVCCYQLRTLLAQRFLPPPPKGGSGKPGEEGGAEMGERKEGGVENGGLERLGMAKASAFGPPLDVKGAAGLKWEDPGVPGIEKESGIAQPPLSLRDNSLLVIRD